MSSINEPILNDEEKHEEQKRINSLSKWYVEEELDFERRLIAYAYRTLKPYFCGTDCLELGASHGQMTRFLVQDFERVTAVDGASELLDLIPNYPNLTKVTALFEDFNPESQFDTIILAHVLEHVAHPVALLRRAKHWLSPEGRLLLVVPNGHSFHRLVGVKMGYLSDPCELNERDYALGHRRVYTPVTFREDVEKSGLRIEEMGGIFFKPVTNKQIQDTWTEQMMDGFYELGKDYPNNAAEIYAVCTSPDTNHHP